MKLTRILRIIHRDLGFLMVGISLVYGISGIYLNHMNGKDPAFRTEANVIQLPANLTSDELSGIIAALKGIGSVSERSHIERTLNKFHAHTDAVISLREPVIIDLASYYKGQLTEKIEGIKCAILEARLIEFDYLREFTDI